MIIKNEGTSMQAPPRYWPEVKADGTGAGSPALEGDAALVEQKRWQLESEAAAIDRLLDAAGAQLGGAAGLVQTQERQRDAASLGYRHMCRFMSLLWFDALSRYEFAMRVSPRSSLTLIPATFDEEGARRSAR